MSIRFTTLTFHNRETYVAWRAHWRAEYREISQQIREKKIEVKKLQRENSPRASSEQSTLASLRAAASHMMELREKATARRKRILELHALLKAQSEMFPQDFGVCKNIEIALNKESKEFPFLPRWTLAMKGQTFYLNGFETHIPESETMLERQKVLRIAKCRISISAELTATLMEEEDHIFAFKQAA